MIQIQDNTMAVNCKYSLLQEDVFNVFVLPSEVVEVRILYVGAILRHGQVLPRSTVSGYFDHSKFFENSASMSVKKQQGIIYFTPQVIDPRLIGRTT